MKISFRPSLNWLFVFIPVTVILEHVAGIYPPLLFFSAALAIIPIARLATGQGKGRQGLEYDESKNKL